MPNNDTSDPNATHDDSSKQSKAEAPNPSAFDSLFSTPPPLKRIFDRVPLVTYSANELPLRALKGRAKNVLHVFTTAEDAQSGRPSFNPACLKWQTYLKFNGIPFATVPSNNHASPSGALPFLLPGVSTSETAKVQEPVPSNKLRRWVGAQKQGEKLPEPDDMCYEAYASLLDHRIRRAWLYQLYLNPNNAPPLHRLYVAPCSSNPFVQLTVSYQLRRAAETEIVKSNPGSSPRTIVEEDIFHDAKDAFEALSTLLGDSEWFFGQEQPSLFDASVFAYTQLLLDERMGWRNNGLGEIVRGHGNLVRHREKIQEAYF